MALTLALVVVSVTETSSNSVNSCAVILDDDDDFGDVQTADNTGESAKTSKQTTANTSGGHRIFTRSPWSDFRQFFSGSAHCSLSLIFQISSGSV